MCLTYCMRSDVKTSHRHIREDLERRECTASSDVTSHAICRRTMLDACVRMNKLRATTTSSPIPASNCRYYRHTAFVVLLTLSADAFHLVPQIQRPQACRPRLRALASQSCASELRSKGFTVLPDLSVGGHLATQVAAQASTRLDELLAAVEAAGELQPPYYHRPVTSPLPNLNAQALIMLSSSTLSQRYMVA